MKVHRRRPSSCATALGLSVITWFALHVAAQAACGRDNLSVEGGPAQTESACRAVGEVEAYFRSMGFDVAPELNVKFANAVFIALHDTQTGKPTSRFQVSGYFDAGRKRIEITSAGSRFRKARRPWGIRWGPTIAYSILQHEIAHAMLHEALAGRNRRISKAWMEFLAYGIQLDIMEPGLKARVLAKYARTRPFDHPDNVNPFIYASDPDEFGIQSYLYMQARGGRNFLHRIIKGQVDFSTEELLWTK